MCCDMKKKHCTGCLKPDKKSCVTLSDSDANMKGNDRHHKAIDIDFEKKSCIALNHKHSFQN